MKKISGTYHFSLEHRGEADFKVVVQNVLAKKELQARTAEEGLFQAVTWVQQEMLRRWRKK